MIVGAVTGGVILVMAVVIVRQRVQWQSVVAATKNPVFNNPNDDDVYETDAGLLRGLRE